MPAHAEVVFSRVRVDFVEQRFFFFCESICPAFPHRRRVVHAHTLERKWRNDGLFHSRVRVFDEEVGGSRLFSARVLLIALF